MHNRISLVQSVKIASPCHASWDQMEGDDRKRFCFQCKKHVYDFSKMTTVEVEELLKNESVCGRIWKRADGHIITADCPVGIRKRREHVAIWFARATTFLAFVGAAGISRVGFKKSAVDPECVNFVESASISQRRDLLHLKRWLRFNNEISVEVGEVTSFKFTNPTGSN